MKPLLILLAVCLAALLFFNVKQGNDLRRVNEELNQQKELLEKTQSTAESALEQEKLRTKQELSAETQKLAVLRTRLQSQKEMAEAARQKLLDARENLREGDQPEDAVGSLKQEKAFIDQLEANLKSVRQWKAALGSRGKLTQEQRKWKKTEIDAEFASQVQVQQQLVEETKSKISGLSGRRDFIGRNALQEAQTELQTRKKALQQLKERRNTILQTWNADDRLGQNEIQAQQTQINQSEQQISQVLQDERARYQAMQKDFSSRQQEHRGRTDEIKRLEAEFQSHQTKVNELQATLKEEELKLRQIGK